MTICACYLPELANRAARSTWSGTQCPDRKPDGRSGTGPARGQQTDAAGTVVKDRKGEHVHLFDSLRRQGFIRARIDGLVCDLDEAPALDKKKKHTIEVVVDRFKVKEDIGLRLAESFETALALAEGLAALAIWTAAPRTRFLAPNLPAPSVTTASMS